MAYNEKLAERIRKVLGKEPGLTEKKIFGGLSFLLNRNMCAGVLEYNLVVGVGPEKYEECLKLPNAKPMDFTGRPMKGFIYVDSDGYKTDKSLLKWIQLGLDFAKSLPPKNLKP